MKPCPSCGAAFCGESRSCDDCRFTAQLAGKLIAGIALNGGAMGACAWVAAVHERAGDHTIAALCYVALCLLAGSTAIFTRRLYRL